MLLDWWKTMLLLPLLIQAQSGDGDVDMEPRVSCTSHISIGKGSNLTCKLVNSRYHIDDDEDEESDVIEKMTACCCNSQQTKCVEEFGETVGSRDLLPAGTIHLTVHLKKGGKIERVIDPKKIVKPKSPWVQNVTFNNKSNSAVVHIQIPYQQDYLNLENQLFQLQIWGAGRNMTPNFTSADTLNIPMQHLQKNKQYHVKVRAIPTMYLQGTWSEWSETYSVFTPPDNTVREGHTEELEIKKICVALVSLVVVTLSVTILWKNKIFTYMWPSIPHPKHTLVQICKPNKGLLLTISPEVFSALKIYPKGQTEEQPSEETQPVILPAADDVQVTNPCSTQSSDCSRSNISVSTEELELLSRNSSEGEESLHSTSPSPVDTIQLREASNTLPPEHINQEHEPEVFGVAQPDEAYVTMSSFYQIK
ncbi:interleukin-7 receptor subunit alpha [Sphaeramia orbicularis]|uniref:Fibronectin type-III domain-containing protein n=1 Tax=Sphaeramia orbicularis TaxID=375764 RepID=A0A673BZQ7_9TELE|nr:interleukin-7 receptor subunit alpha [Sphaeramia orbicularis]